MQRTHLSETEYEQVRATQNINVELHQQVRGRMDASLGMRRARSASFYYSEINLAFTAHLIPPEKCVSLLALDSPRGLIRANGRVQERGGLLVIPQGKDADFIAPGATSSDSATIASRRFFEIADAISPGLQSFERPTIVRGEPASLDWLRKRTRTLVREPCLGPDDACFDNVVAEWFALLGQSEAKMERHHSPASRHRARIARQARAYFADNYARPIRMEDVCGDVGVGLRTLQRCFMDYFQMSPFQFLKVLRYNKARHALLEHDPTTSSVTRIAMDSGFRHFGRFATEYRDLFGERPRDTLADRPVSIAA